MTSQSECTLRLNYIGQHLPSHTIGYQLGLCEKGQVNKEIPDLKVS